jgi:hypothetical protein
MNPFMNPNQRGVGLPPGCKDLMDVIRSMPVAEGPIGRDQLRLPKAKNVFPQGAPQIEIGQIKDIEAMVARFLKHKKSSGLFSVANPARRIFLTVMCHDEKLSLNVFVYRVQPAVKEALRRVFRDERLCRSEREAEHVNVPLGDSAEQITKVLKELLVSGFGVSEEEPLLFHAHGKAG